MYVVLRSSMCTAHAAHAIYWYPCKWQVVCFAILEQYIKRKKERERERDNYRKKALPSSTHQVCRPDIWNHPVLRSIFWSLRPGLPQLGGITSCGICACHQESAKNESNIGRNWFSLQFSLVRSLSSHHLPQLPTQKQKPCGPGMTTN